MISEAEAASFADHFATLTAGVAAHIRGKHEQIELAVTCLLAGGHLLVEDVPGVAKTSLAKALAEVIGGEFKRVQFTADLLPSDVTGVRIFNRNGSSGDFHFEKGPVFTNILLGDEINRASPKTQAALLEVMAERQVTVAGRPVPVPDPFLCIGTQNPVEFYGTYSLPEAQLDRFTMRLSLGYPTVDQEAEVIVDNMAGRRPGDSPPVSDPARVREQSAMTRKVHLAPTLLRYIAEIAAATRGTQGEQFDIRLGVSPRGSIALASCAAVRAASAGRVFATDDDVKDVAVPVLAHRLTLGDAAEPSAPLAETVVEKVLAQVPVPRRRDLEPIA
jgi:MoxR-like ATPase